MDSEHRHHDEQQTANPTEALPPNSESPVSFSVEIGEEVKEDHTIEGSFTMISS